MSRTTGRRKNTLPGTYRDSVIVWANLSGSPIHGPSCRTAGLAIAAMAPITLMSVVCRPKFAGRMIYRRDNAADLHRHQKEREGRGENDSRVSTPPLCRL